MSVAAAAGLTDTDEEVVRLPSVTTKVCVPAVRSTTPEGKDLNPASAAVKVYAAGKVACESEEEKFTLPV
jgi:hypothetical protein